MSLIAALFGCGKRGGWLLAVIMAAMPQSTRAGEEAQPPGRAAGVEPGAVMSDDEIRAVLEDPVKRRFLDTVAAYQSRFLTWRIALSQHTYQVEGDYIKIPLVGDATPDLSFLKRAGVMPTGQMEKAWWFDGERKQWNETEYVPGTNDIRDVTRIFEGPDHTIKLTQGTAPGQDGGEVSYRDAVIGRLSDTGKIVRDPHLFDMMWPSFLYQTVLFGGNDYRLTQVEGGGLVYNADLGGGIHYIVRLDPAKDMTPRYFLYGPLAQPTICDYFWDYRQVTGADGQTFYLPSRIMQVFSYGDTDAEGNYHQDYATVSVLDIHLDQAEINREFTLEPPLMDEGTRVYDTINGTQYDVMTPLRPSITKEPKAPVREGRAIDEIKTFLLRNRPLATDEELRAVGIRRLDE